MTKLTKLVWNDRSEDHNLDLDGKWKDDEANFGFETDFGDLTNITILHRSRGSLQGLLQIHMNLNVIT